MSTDMHIHLEIENHTNPLVLGKKNKLMSWWTAFLGTRLYNQASERERSYKVESSSTGPHKLLLELLYVRVSGRNFTGQL